MSGYQKMLFVNSNFSRNNLFIFFCLGQIYISLWSLVPSSCLVKVRLLTRDVQNQNQDTGLQCSAYSPPWAINKMCRHQDHAQPFHNHTAPRCSNQGRWALLGKCPYREYLTSFFVFNKTWYVCFFWWSWGLHWHRSMDHTDLEWLAYSGAFIYIDVNLDASKMCEALCQACLIVKWMLADVELMINYLENVRHSD